jgi:SSS family solute:Na+ symporter
MADLNLFAAFTLSRLDVLIFIAFVLTVVGVGLYQSRGERAGSSEDYFLAGRGLKWWLIGFSLIAANISTEQFVGMSGNAASHVGLAIASYEWMAAITLVVVGFAFLPYFLRVGIFTMPEFLEHRFDARARTYMAVATILIYLLLLGSVTYSGALTIKTLAGQAGFQLTLAQGSLIIGLVAMIYVTAGGLKACAWADLIQGSALVLGGAVIMWFAFHQLGQATEAAAIVSAQTGAVEIRPLAPGTGALARFWELNTPRMNMFLPRTDAVLPWTALLLGLWIPNFYYWGLNQYITQRTLGSASLAEGQRGIVFAAFLKLLIPFVIVIPGIIAFNLYSHEMRLEAGSDKAAALARYLKANPQTQFVERADAPTEAQIAAWAPGRYLIAVYPDERALAAVRVRHPHVLPMTRAQFEAAVPAEFTLFVPGDHSWKAVNPGLAEEIEAFNARVEAAAQAARRKPAVEKLIAYKYDTALAQLLGHVLPQGTGLTGFVLAALLGAVVSSLAAMLNAASTIFAMDVFKKHLARTAPPATVVTAGRLAVVGFAVVAVLLAPRLGDPKISNSIFTIIQAGQGFISPGILSVFAFGLVVRRAPPVCGIAGLVTNLVVYGFLMLFVPSVQFLNAMAICFGVCLVVMLLLTLARPLPQPFAFTQQSAVALETSHGAKLAGGLVILITLVLYVIFSPLVAAR